MSNNCASKFSDPAQTWNSRFQQEGFLFGKLPNEWLCQHASALPSSGHILCVADGEGRNSVWLAGLGHEVDAFDIAEVGVAKARRLAETNGVTVNYRVDDCDSFPWPRATYDAVVAIFIQFADPELRERLFANVVDSLKPGGVLILQGYTPKQLEYKTGGPPILSHLYTEEMLRTAFEGMHMEVLRTYEADLQEGCGHSGRSALIGMVARK